MWLGTVRENSIYGRVSQRILFLRYGFGTLSDVGYLTSCVRVRNVGVLRVNA